MNFQELEQKSIYYHQDTRIAGSQGKKWSEFNQYALIFTVSNQN